MQNFKNIPTHKEKAVDLHSNTGQSTYMYVFKVIQNISFLGLFASIDSPD